MWRCPAASRPSPLGGGSAADLDPPSGFSGLWWRAASPVGLERYRSLSRGWKVNRIRHHSRPVCVLSSVPQRRQVRHDRGSRTLLGLISIGARVLGRKKRGLAGIGFSVLFVVPSRSDGARHCSSSCASSHWLVLLSKMDRAHSLQRKRRSRYCKARRRRRCRLPTTACLVQESTQDRGDSAEILWTTGGDPDGLALVGDHFYLPIGSELGAVRG